jgi:hypothetical protein
MRRSKDRVLKSTVRMLCRECHDVLERIIMRWERKVTKLWEQYPEFYAWVVDAFLDTADERTLDPPDDQLLSRWPLVWLHEQRTA